MMILVMTFPMFIFTIYPALKLGDYLEARYGIAESSKRAVVIAGTFIVALALAAFLQFA